MGEGGLKSSLALVEYVGKFPGLASHGNSRGTNEYIRTPDYVLDEIAHRVAIDKPKQIYDALKVKYDEVTGPSSIQQVKDKKKNLTRTDAQHSRKNIADHIQTLQTMIGQGHPFVRCLIHSSNKSPCTILYTDEQLQDIKNYCCTGQTILGVDKTFNLCDMHVTVTCYKQLSVVRPKTNDHPLFFGPMYIHDNSDFEAYCQFFLHLKMKLASSPLGQLVIGSDDEHALVKSVTTAFPESTHILCIRHLRKNALQKLTDDAVTLTDRNSLLDMIFGDKGIVASDDSICFEAKCDLFEGHCAGISQSFLRYFQSRLRPQLKAKVVDPCHKEVTDGRWTNNNCESVNHILKQAIDWKSKPLTDLVEILHNLVKGQFADLRSALIGTGEFRLSDTQRHFQVTKTDYIQMSSDRRNKVFDRFRRFLIPKPGYTTSTDGLSTIVAPRTHGKKPGQVKRKVNVRTLTNKRPKV